MNHALATAGLPPAPDPPQDRRARPVPPATAELLILLQVLLVYARHLINTLQQQSQRALSLIAHYFGSAQAAFVLTNLTSGILRAIALERVLLARANGAPTDGQPDPAAGTPRKRTPQTAQPNAHPAAGLQASDPDRRPGLPTLQQLEAAIRRRPVERVIDDIRHAFGLSFSLCEPRFGNALRDAFAAYRDTVASFCKEHLGREASIADAPEQILTSDDPPQQPDGIPTIAGFLGAKLWFPIHPSTHRGGAATLNLPAAYSPAQRSGPQTAAAPPFPIRTERSHRQAASGPAAQ